MEHDATQGRAAPSWPKEHGGPGWWDPMQRYLFAVEYARAGALRLSALSNAYARTQAGMANCLEPGAIGSIITQKHVIVG